MEQTTELATLQRADGSFVEIQTTLSLGRDPSNHLVIEQDDVSRRHAIIHCQGHREYCLLDLGSSNGTLLQGRPVVQAVPLEDQDEILIGSERLIFRAPDATAPKQNSVGSTNLNVRVAKQWLLVADIEGFTSLSQSQPPSQLARTVGAWFAETRGAVEKYGGLMHQYFGDGWFCGWNDAPQAAARIVACLAELGNLQKKSILKFRLVLHFGDVSVSESPATADYGITGADVDFVFGMEKLACTLQVALLLSDEARQRMPTQLLTIPVGEHQLNGLQGSHIFHA